MEKTSLNSNQKLERNNENKKKEIEYSIILNKSYNSKKLEDIRKSEEINTFLEKNLTVYNLKKGKTFDIHEILGTKKSNTSNITLNNNFYFKYNTAYQTFNSDNNTAYQTFNSDNNRENSVSMFFKVLENFLEKKPKIFKAFMEYNGFNKFGLCPNKEIEYSIKNKYIEIKRKGIEERLKKFGLKINLEEVFKSKKCEPIKLKEKFNELVKKKGIKLSQKDIIFIIENIGDIKNISFKSNIEKNLKNIGLTDIEIKNFFYNLSNESLINILYNDEIRKKYISGLLGDKKSKLDINNFSNLVFSYIKSKDTIKYLTEIQNFKKLENNEIVVNNIYKDKNGGENGDFILNNSFNDKYLDDYKILIKQHNSVYSFVLDKILSPLPINIKNKIITRFTDGKEISSKQGILKLQGILNNIIEKFNFYIPKAIEKRVKNLSNSYLNNYLEEEMLIKSKKLLNTEYIWIYSNNESELKKYNPIMPNENISKKYKNLKWQNNLCKREDFIKTIKSIDNIENINNKGLIDYILKTKIKYQDWKTAFGVIYVELGKEKFNKLIKFLKNTTKKETSKFKKLFKEENLDHLFEIAEKYTDFRKNIVGDIKIIEESIKHNESSFLNKNISNNIKKIEEGSLDKEQKVNLVSYSVKKGNLEFSNVTEVNKLLKMGTYTALIQILNNGENIDDILRKVGEENIDKAENLRSAFELYITFQKELGINIIDLSPEAFKEFLDNIFIDPLKASEILAIKLSKNKKLDLNMQEKIINIILKKYNDGEKLIELLKSLNQEKNKKKRLKVAKEIINILRENIFIKNTFTRLLELKFKKNSSYFKKLSYPLINEERLLALFNKNTNIKKFQEKLNKSSQLALLAQKKVQAEKNGNKKEKQKLIKQYYEKLIQGTETGLYSEKEKRIIYSNIYNNKYISNNLKEKVKKLARKEIIETKEIETKEKETKESNNKEKKIGNKIDIDNKLSININYTTSNGVVKIKSPFENELSENIEATSIRKANEKLILKYFQKLGFYKADEIIFPKDSEKIIKQLGIDITKKISKNDIIKLSENLVIQLFYKLDNIKLTRIQKEYFNSFKNNFKIGVNSIETLENIMYFLNNNEMLASQIGIYDFTENIINLENLENKNNLNFIKYSKSFK